MSVYTVASGYQHPLGTTVNGEGVNFSLFSRNATAVELLLFGQHDDPEPIQTITLDPKVNKTFHIWHLFVEGLKPGMHYAYRIDGPRDANAGFRFNPNKVLLDPYGYGATDNLFVRGDACGDMDNLTTSMRNVIIDLDAFDWEEDTPISRPMAETVIYEMHVGGFTRSETSAVENPGTYQGIIEKIPYLKALGITAVELLPIMQFDDSNPVGHGADGTPLTNYWGYSTISFFAPHPGYCVSSEEGKHIEEFRHMVKALHKAGIEVILDVVFNHTDEGNHMGPTLSFKGIDNHTCYHLVQGSEQYYMDYTGCGNTVNCNHPIMQKFILECLEFWVKEMHVDGFRFDEASILSRGPDGAPMEYPPLLWQIELSEALSDTKVIAEAWDAGGLYQIGHFPGYRWAEWNGIFRDDMRKFVKGDPGLISAIANRISGSSDLYQSTGHLPTNSINFITCHDGFTLNDLVSYNHKHNEMNGEENNDGVNDNLSWNCGAEGESSDEEIEKLRDRQVKNFATVTMLSRGVPMILAGDEVRRTQSGNNNTYCQDNETNWFDWSLVEKHAQTLRYFQKIIAFRKEHRALYTPRFFDGTVNERGVADVSWHSTRLNAPGWDDPQARALAFTLGGLDGEADLHVMMNMYWDALTFELPEIKGYSWYRIADTSYASPKDFVEREDADCISGASYLLAGRSIAILINKPN